MSHFPRIDSSVEAQAEADKITSVWSAETVLIIRLLIYIAGLLEQVLRK
jgi:hypothetical protein